MLVKKLWLEEGRIVGELMVVWMPVGSLNRSRYEGKGMKMVWTYRLMCDRSMGGEGLRRWVDVVCRWTIDQKS